LRHEVHSTSCNLNVRFVRTTREAVRPTERGFNEGVLARENAGVNQGGTAETSVLGQQCSGAVFVLEGECAMAMSDDLKAIEAQVQRGLTSVESPEALEALRVNVLGRKGSLTAIMHMMGQGLARGASGHGPARQHGAHQRR